MISLNKPAEAPKVLQNKGQTATESLCAEVQTNRADYESGAKKLDFDSAIYGHKEVKDALIAAQHGKCFLCESRIRHISHGDVEHYRPKGGFCQSVKDKLSTPGYYWLAYVWENLFLACQLCNQRFKKNLFPLKNPDARATSHDQDFSQESPLFINPTIENPENYISFRGVFPIANNGNLKGATTIEHAGLRRDELKENRRELYAKMKSLYKLAHGQPETPYKEKALALLENDLQECQSPQHQYTAMFRAAARDKFHF